MANSKKRKCVNCHFLGMSGFSSFRGQGLGLVSQAQREACSRGDFSWFNNPNDWLACYQGVDELGEQAKQEEYYDRLIAPRDTCPSYWKFRPDMQFATADALQEAEKERRKYETTIRLAALGLILSAVFSFLTLLERLFEFAVARSWIRLP